MFMEELTEQRKVQKEMQANMEKILSIIAPNL